MARDPTKRCLTLDLSDLRARLEQAPDIPQDEGLALRACILIESVVQSGAFMRELDAAYLSRVTDEEFAAAHAIIEGGEGHASYRLIAEQVDEDAFAQYVGAFADLRSVPDSSVAEEYI